MSTATCLEITKIYGTNTTFVEYLCSRQKMDFCSFFSVHCLPLQGYLGTLFSMGPHILSQLEGICKNEYFFLNKTFFTASVWSRPPL